MFRNKQTSTHTHAFMHVLPSNTGGRERKTVPAAGFHQGSQIKTRLAAVRFSATPPAFNEIRNTVTVGSFENFLIEASRWYGVMCPSNFTHY